MNLDNELASAATKIHYRTMLRASDAKTEIRAMAESARRSIGQRVRWAAWKKCS